MVWLWSRAGALIPFMISHRVFLCCKSGFTTKVRRANLLPVVSGYAQTGNNFRDLRGPLAQSAEQLTLNQ